MSNPLTVLAQGSYELGRSLLDAGKVSEAALIFKKTLLLDPLAVDAALALGHCLYQQAAYDEAVALYDRLLAEKPHHAALWNNRGTALLALCRHDEAAASYRRAVTLEPHWHDSWIALATCCQALAEYVLAEEICIAVIAAVPEHAEAHWNRALLLLLKGEYSVGWREYEWRWQKRGFTSPRRDFAQPRWQGESLVGKTILIHAEQGFGDTLQFCRYVPLVATLGGRVIFECQSPLVTLMKGLAGQVTVVAMGEPLPDFDLQIPLLSLAGLFATTVDTVPAAVPYLDIPPERQQHWQRLVAGDDGFKVGICWAGKTYPDPLRSCPVAAVQELAGIAGVSWYSLQVGWQQPLPFAMTDVTGAITDFADTAALIAQLDLVISIDTATAHLAGALAVPTLVMLPYAADWRWLTAQNYSPWYPTVQLIRQKSFGDWQSVIKRIQRMDKLNV